MVSATPEHVDNSFPVADYPQDDTRAVEGDYARAREFALDWPADGHVLLRSEAVREYSDDSFGEYQAAALTEAEYEVFLREVLTQEEQEQFAAHRTVVRMIEIADFVETFTLIRMD